MNTNLHKQDCKYGFKIFLVFEFISNIFLKFPIVLIRNLLPESPKQQSLMQQVKKLLATIPQKEKRKSHILPLVNASQ